MSVLKEFDDLHITVKTICIGLALLMPFWYLDLFLFSHLPFDKAYQIPVVISFCLSICWFVAQASTYVLFMSVLNIHKVIIKEQDESTDFQVIILSSIFYLAILTIIGYYYKFKFHNLVFGGFSFAALRFALYFSYGLFRRKKVKKN